MILKNWWAYLAAIYANPVSNQGQSTILTEMVDINGGDVTILTTITGYVSDRADQLTKLNPKIGLSFGLSSTSTEPTYSEFRDLGDVTDRFSITQNFTTSWEEGKEITIGTITAISLETVVDHTINSINIYRNIVDVSGGTHKVLMLREILEEPIFVPIHGSFQRTFKWESM